MLPKLSSRTTKGGFEAKFPAPEDDTFPVLSGDNRPSLPFPVWRGTLTDSLKLFKVGCLVASLTGCNQNRVAMIQLN